MKNVRSNVRINTAISVMILIILCSCKGQSFEPPAHDDPSGQDTLSLTPQPEDVMVILNDVFDEEAGISSPGAEDTGLPDTELPGEADGMIDLTVMSSTMVYSQVYDMVCHPENYTGKKVKMEGVYSEFLDTGTGNRYHCCIISDATACCAQGIEFIPTDDHIYPDDYPQEGDTVIVEGEFSVYTEDDTEYCTLKNAMISDIIKAERS